MMNNIFLVTLATLVLGSCSSGITKSRVCTLENFDALKGCKSHAEEIVGFPETVIHSFRANDFEENTKVAVNWYFESQGKFYLIDSFQYYTREKEELIVSGIDRNFLQPGNFLVKVKVQGTDQVLEQEEHFTIVSSGEPSALMLLVGNIVDPNGYVIQPKTYFSKTDDRIYVSSYIYDVNPNQNIIVRFKQVDVEGFEREFKTNVGPNPKPIFLFYANLPNVKLPLGEYEVQILLGESTFTAPFYIDETLQSEF